MQEKVLSLKNQKQSILRRYNLITRCVCYPAAVDYCLRYFSDQCFYINLTPFLMYEKNWLNFCAEKIIQPKTQNNCMCPKNSVRKQITVVGQFTIIIFSKLKSGYCLQVLNLSVEYYLLIFVDITKLKSKKMSPVQSIFSFLFLSLSVNAARQLIDTNNDQLQHLMVWGDNIYSVSSSPATYDQAKEICAAAGATLVNIQSPYESFTIARRFAGSDYGNHSVNAFTSIDWSSSDVPSKVAVWIANSPQENNYDDDNSDVFDIWMHHPSVSSDTLDANKNECTYLEATNSERDGLWCNDKPKQTKMHFVCKQSLKSNEDASKNSVRKSTIFASLTLDCIVSPLQLSVSHVLKKEDEDLLMVVVPFPSECSMKGFKSSTGVVSVDVEGEPMPVRYFIVDPTRKGPLPFEGGIMTYVNSVDDMLQDSAVSQIM
eukprot:TRINITY_DN6430_c0_g1_i1.p1 TRINITY_DN6430_c0_g1~~TRINITY_DN6430_c0_g1_i1.p1  ORF type:complete len:430 (-),score=41.96 TRINITY_DN6430_c0_g1_i1:1624-2913(-)